MTIRMSLSGANRKTSTVEMRELLNDTERRRLLQQLSAKRGVCSAYFSADEPRRLTFEYDADLVSALAIFDFLQSCALHVQFSLRPERPRTTTSPLTPPSALVGAALRPTADRPVIRT